MNTLVYHMPTPPPENILCICNIGWLIEIDGKSCLHCLIQVLEGLIDARILKKRCTLVARPEVQQT